jgi:hypothetical protein
MTLAFKTFLLVIDLGPDTLFATQIGPQVDGCPEILVTRITKSDLVNLSGLETHRRCTGITLQPFMSRESVAIITEFAEQSRTQLLANTRQRSKDTMVTMVLENGLYTLAVCPKLLLQHA